jgi:hypothetical protein
MEPVVDSFMQKIDGGEALSSALAEWFEDAKKNQVRAGPMFARILEMIQNEDKARVHQNFTEEIAESHERGFVIEYALGDIDVLNTINRMAIERGMIPAPHAIEAEYARIG